MATAAYNAGPGRPTEWTGACGDPRMSSTDPADFIECIPFSETRNYVMRVMEGMRGLPRPPRRRDRAADPASRPEARRLQLRRRRPHRPLVRRAGDGPHVVALATPFSPCGRRWLRSGRMRAGRMLLASFHPVNQLLVCDPSAVDFVDTFSPRGEKVVVGRLSPILAHAPDVSRRAARIGPAGEATSSPSRREHLGQDLARQRRSRPIHDAQAAVRAAPRGGRRRGRPGPGRARSPPPPRPRRRAARSRSRISSWASGSRPAAGSSADQQRRAGGQQPRQQHPRPLAARHVEHAAAGQRVDLQLGQAGAAPAAWPSAGASPAAPSAATSQRRHVPGDPPLLRQIAGDGGALALAELVQRPAGRGAPHRPTAAAGPARRAAAWSCPRRWDRPGPASRPAATLSADAGQDVAGRPRRTARRLSSSSAALMRASSAPRARPPGRTAARRRGR